MDFQTFAALLLERLGLAAVGPVQPSTGLFDELGFDSLQAFETLIIIETAAGLDVPPADLPEIYTVGDAFDYYRSARTVAASQF
jgi:acyl carrier protein